MKLKILNNLIEELINIIIIIIIFLEIDKNKRKILLL